MQPSDSSYLPQSEMAVSSNSVIWQGPDIKCINLCKGDSVTKVIAKVADEVLSLQQQLDLADLDLACLVQDCVQCPQPDKSLQAVLKLIIAQVCALSGDSTTTSVSNPELVPIADCFNFVDSDGNTIKNMSANAYLQKVGTNLCTALITISQLNSTLASQGGRITALENYEHPEYQNPTIFAACLFPNNTGTPIDIVEAFEELEKQFCNLRSVTGLPTDLAQSIARQCIGLNTQPAFSMNGSMSTLPGWKTQPTSIADTLTNLWLTLCDLRAGLQTAVSAIPTGCGLITVDFGITLTGSGSTLTAKVVFAGYSTIPDTYNDCPGGSIITITDAAGNVLTKSIQLASLKNSSDGVSIALGNTLLNTASNFSVRLDSCLTNGSNTCNKTLTKQVANGSTCPTITTTPSTTAIGFSFNNTGSAGTSFKIDIMNGNATAVLNSQVFSGSGATFSGSFTGLTPNTPYNLRVTIDNGVIPFVCSVQSVNTSAANCAVPTGVSATVTPNI